MTYSHEVERMCPLTKGPNHGPAPIPEEGNWVKAYEIKDISGYTHGVGWCAPQQGTCKLSLNVKNGVIEEALVETIGCSGMTHSAAMAGEILPGKTILEALNTDLVCDAINVAMRELFLQIVYGRSQTAFSEDGLPIGAGLEDLGKGLRSMTGTIFSTRAKGVRYLELTAPHFERIITVQPQNPRSLSAEALADEAKHFCKDVQPAQSMKDAIEKATVSGDEVLVICGSFFLASEIRDLAIEKYKA